MAAVPGTAVLELEYLLQFDTTAPLPTTGFDSYASGNVQAARDYMKRQERLEWVSGNGTA